MQAQMQAQQMQLQLQAQQLQAHAQQPAASGPSLGQVVHGINGAMQGLSLVSQLFGGDDNN